MESRPLERGRGRVPQYSGKRLVLCIIRIFIILCINTKNTSELVQVRAPVRARLSLALAAPCPMAATSKDEKWEGPLMPTVQPAAVPFAAVQQINKLDIAQRVAQLAYTHSGTW